MKALITYLAFGLCGAIAARAFSDADWSALESSILRVADAGDFPPSDVLIACRLIEHNSTVPTVRIWTISTDRRTGSSHVSLEFSSFSESSTERRVALEAELPAALASVLHDKLRALNRGTTPIRPVYQPIGDGSLLLLQVFVDGREKIFIRQEPDPDTKGVFDAIRNSLPMRHRTTKNK